MKAYIFILAAILLFAGSVNAWNTNIFSNNLTSENLSFGSYNTLNETDNIGSDFRNQPFEYCTNINIANGGKLKITYSSSQIYPFATIRVRDSNRNLLEELNDTNKLGLVYSNNIYIPGSYAFCLTSLNNTVASVTITSSHYSGYTLTGTTYPTNSAPYFKVETLDQTRFLSVPQNILLTNGFLNLTGMSYNSSSQQRADLNTCLDAGNWNGGSPCTNVYDNNWGSAGYYSPNCIGPKMQNGTILWNYTIAGSPINITWNVRDSYGYGNMNIPNTAVSNGILQLEGISQTETTGIAGCGSNAYSNASAIWAYYDGANWIKIRNNTQVNCGATFDCYNYRQLFEQNITLNSSYYPTNTIIKINGNTAFNQTGQLTTTNKTSNIASVINSYLSSCTYSNGFCLVPFVFSSTTLGILQYSSLIFNNEGFIENSESYNSNTYETSKENFILNLTFDPSYYQVATANLIYNGTSYSSIKTTSGFNNIFNASIDIPLINVAQKNNSFYWQVILTNSSGSFYAYSNTYNQTVNQINLSTCGSLPTNQLALNITAYDQDSSNQLSNWTFKSTISYFTGSGSIYRTAYFNNQSISEKDICINQNTTFKLNGLVEYSATSYQPSTYYFVNYPISNATTSLGLGLELSASSTQFIIQLVNQNNLALPGYYININRCSASNITNCQTVQVVQTDSNGQGVAFIVPYNVFYQFVVKDANGNTLYTSDTRKISLQTSPYTITLTIGQGNQNPLNYLNNVTGMTFNGPSYSQTSNLVTYSYTDNNLSFVNSELLVTMFNASGTNSIICDVNNSNASAVLTCDLTGRNGTVIATAYTYRPNQIYVSSLTINLDSGTGAGLLGLFGAFFILMICAFVFAFSETAGIIMMNAGVILVSFLGLISFSWVFIISMVGISIIILVILERG